MANEKEGVEQMKRVVKLVVFTAIWTVLMCQASLGAQDEGGVDAVIMIDTSGSMKETDPDRISVDAAKLFIDMMETSGSRAGVVPFSDKLGTVKNLTVMNSVDEKSGIKDEFGNVVYEGDTDIGMAVQRGFQLFGEDQDIENQKMMLLFTDGNIDLPGENEEQREEASLNAVKDVSAKAKEAGIPIYTIGLNANGKVDQGLLRDIADLTEGRSFVVNSPEDLPGIFNEIFADFVNSNIMSLGEYVTDGVNFTEIPIEIPNDSVLEANIIMLSPYPITEVEMTDPQGSVYRPDGEKLILSQSNQYSMLKVVMPESGKWQLRIKSAKGCKVHVNLFFNYRVSLKGTAQLETGDTEGSRIVVKGHLEKEGMVLEDEVLYRQFTGSAIVTDTDNAQHIYPLSRNGCSFEGSIPVDKGGTYEIVLRVDSDTMYRESEKMEVFVDMDTEEEKEEEENDTDKVMVPANHPPFLEKELPDKIQLSGFLGVLVKENLNLNEYFSDPDEDSLNFEYALGGNCAKVRLGDEGELTLSPAQNGEDVLTVTATDPEGLSVSGQIPVVASCTVMGFLPLLLAPVILIILVIVLMKIRRAGAIRNAPWFGKIKWMVVKGSGFGSSSREQGYDMGYERGTVALGRIITDPLTSGMDLNKVTMHMNAKTNSSIYIQNRSRKCRMVSGYGGSEVGSIELKKGDFVMLVGKSEGTEISVRVTYS